MSNCTIDESKTQTTIMDNDDKKYEKAEIEDSRSKEVISDILMKMYVRSIFVPISEQEKSDYLEFLYSPSKPKLEDTGTSSE